MARNEHFLTVTSWDEAEAHLTFRPRRPADTAGRTLNGLSILVRDHRHRDVPIASRSLEAHYGAFVVTQERKGVGEAKRWALAKSYGQAPIVTRVAGHDARAYDRGPEPPPDDIDGRMPAVVVWHDGEMFYLVASSEFESDTLLVIAESLYA